MCSAYYMARTISRGIGAFYIALGERARKEATESIHSLRRVAPMLPVRVVSDQPMPLDIDWRLSLDPHPGGRDIKTRLFDFIPIDWNSVLYLDADTRVRLDPTVGFKLLEDGWDMAIMPSAHQGLDAFWHIDSDEREITYDEIGFIPLQLQAGVMFITRNRQVEQFFDAWYAEWTRYADQDQAAFVRALQREPIKLWLLGKPFNGGAIVAHHFGQARADIRVVSQNR